MRTGHELERAIETRDRFLLRVADHLAAGVGPGSRGEPRDALVRRLDRLRGLARELGIIAAPMRPIVLAPRRLELTRVLRGVLEPITERSRGAVLVETTRGGSVTGRWDEGLLGSAVAELVSNAMKYRHGAPVTVGVRVTATRARIVVTNRGEWSGPSGSVERFRREETRASVQGFGIGVWLTSRIARAHGGALRFACRDGETHATLSLPYEAVRGDPARFLVRLTRLRPPRAS